MTAKHNCSGTAYEVTGFHRCFRNATVERDGQWWCWQHDPERVEADKKKRRAAWAVEADRQADVWERRARNVRLVALVTEELAELLEQLADIAVRVASQTEAVYDIDHPLAVKQNKRVDEARATAARIREALGVNDA